MIMALTLFGLLSVLEIIIIMRTFFIVYCLMSLQICRNKVGGGSLFLVFGTNISELAGNKNFMI